MLYTVVTGDGFLGTKISDKLAVNLLLGKTSALVAIIGTEAIGGSRDVSIGASALDHGLSVSIGSFYSSYVIISWYFGKSYSSLSLLSTENCLEWGV